MTKLYRLIRKEDGFSVDHGIRVKGEVWVSYHTGEGSVFTKTKLKNRWNLQWLYWHNFWGIPLVSDNNPQRPLPYTLAKFEEQSTFELQEVKDAQ